MRKAKAICSKFAVARALATLSCSFGRAMGTLSGGRKGKPLVCPPHPGGAVDGEAGDSSREERLSCVIGWGSTLASSGSFEWDVGTKTGESACD